MSDLLRIASGIAAQVDARVEDGRCGCGCGTVIGTGGNGRRRYFDQSHRQRHYRHKLRVLAEAEGVPARLSLRVVQSVHDTGHRNGDAQRPRRKRQSKPRTGLSVYFSTVRDAQLAAEWIDHLRGGPDATIELEGAAGALDRALTRHAGKAAA